MHLVGGTETKRPGEAFPSRPTCLGWDWIAPTPHTPDEDDPIPRRLLSSVLPGGGRPRVSCVLWCAAGRSAARWCTCARRATGGGGIATRVVRGGAVRRACDGPGAGTRRVRRAGRTGACGSVGAGLGGAETRRHRGMLSRISLPFVRRRRQSGIQPARMGWRGWPGGRAEPGVAVAAAVGRWCGLEPRSGDFGG